MKHAFLALFILSANVLICQEPVYHWGEINSNNYEAPMVKIITADESGFYVLREGGPITQEIRILEKYDKQNNIVFSENLITENPGILGNSLLYRQVIAGDHQFFIFYDKWNKAEGKASCYVRTMNSDGKITGEGKELVSNSAEKQTNSGNYIPVLSPDGSKLLIMTEMPTEKEANEKIKLDVFDAATLQPVWNSEYTLLVESKAGRINYPLIDNGGNVYMFKQVNGPKQIVNYFLYSVNAKDKKLVTNSVDLQGKIATDYHFLFDSNQHPVVAGLYGPNDIRFEGIFYSRIEPSTGSIGATKLDPFGSELLKNFKFDAGAEKEGATLMTLDVKDILAKSDGSILVIIEDIDITTTTSTTTTTGLVPEKELNIRATDIMVVNVGQSGAKLWFTILQKMQNEKRLESQIGYSSFCYALVNDKLYVFWDNIDLTPPSIPPQSWKESDGTVYVKKEVFDPSTTRHATFLYVINQDGTQVYGNRKFGLPLFNLHKGSPFSLSMNPNIFYGTNSGIILLAHVHDEAKRYRFGFVELK